MARWMGRASKRVAGLAAVIIAVVLGVVAAVVLPVSGTGSGSSEGDGGASSGTGAGRPNILLVVTDDMSLSDLEYMPRTQQLIGDAGATFGSFISNHPLCCPARAQLMTGQNAQSNKVFDNTGRHGGYKRLRQPGNNIGAWLQDAGYRTAFVGKHLNGWERGATVQPGWDVFNPTLRGVYAPYGITMFNGGDPTTYDDVYTADLMGELTVDYIEEFAATGDPFFIWTSQLPPHGMNVNKRWIPPVPAERHRDAYSDAMPPAWGLPVFLEEDVTDKPAWVQQSTRPTAEKMVRLHQQRVRSLLSVDEQVAAAVEALERAGVLDNTFIFFTSDNGYAVGEHGLTTKNHPYETSLQVPLAVRGPGVPAGVVTDAQYALVDLPATLVDIADATAGRRQDGRSLLPTLVDGEPGYESYLIQASGWKYEPELKWWWRGVRSPQHTYVRYHDGVEELYDRSVDPQQLTNVADDPTYASTKANLASRLDELVDCEGTACQTEP